MTPVLDRRASVWALLCATLLVPASALAHPRIDAARRHVAEADFDAAERDLAAAEAATDLTRTDAIALYEGRALLAHALHDDARLEANLRRLAALDPSHTFAPGLPPEIPATFTRIRVGVAALEVIADATAGAATATVRVVAQVRGDPGGLVREVRLSVRVAGGPWRTVSRPGGQGGAEVVLDTPNGEEVELWAVAIGPGSAPVAQHGTEAAPLVLAGGPAATAVAGEEVTTTGTTTTTDLAGLGDTLRSLQALGEAFEDPAERPEPQPREDSSTFEISGWAVVAIVVGAALIAGGIYLLVTTEGDDTMPGAPTIAGF